MVEFILFKLFNDNKKITLDRLYNIIGEKIICTEEKNIVCIPYQYSHASREKIKRIEKELGLKKYILTNSDFYKILENSLYYNLSIQKINLTEDLEESHQYLREYINKFNVSNLDNDKYSLIDKIIEELEWCYDEEEIFVKSIEVRMMKNRNKALYLCIDKYGILSADLEVKEEDILSIVNKCLY